MVACVRWCTWWTVAACGLAPLTSSALPPRPEGVQYRFELLKAADGAPVGAETPTTAVRVTLMVQGEQDGTSRFGVAPSWGGVQNCERFIHNLAVAESPGPDRSGATLCALTTDPAAPHGWNVAHRPGATLTATWELLPAAPDPLAEFHTHYEPVVRDDLLHLIGETGLVYPEWLEGKGPIDIQLTWAGFEEHAWATASSFDGDAPGGALTRGADRTISVHRPLQAFRHAMFLAGRLRVHDRDIRGGLLRIAIYGEDWEFKDPELVELIERIVTVEREFADDFADPYFLVTVAPTGPRATPQSVSIGGTGLSNCFALFLPPGTAVAPRTPHRNRILHLLAHEYFHTWNGGGGEIETAEPEEFVYWFSEGFTDFYASRLLRRAGLIEEGQWLERLNETIKSLWLSPVATEPAETIRREFWSRREVQQLPYQRGELVALMLDEEIRRVSSGDRSLDDFFRELLADARSPAHEKADTGRLLARIERWTSPRFASAIRRVVADGALPDLPERATDPVRMRDAIATREDIDTHRYDPGFDTRASVDAKAAVGVRDGGPAHAAGLREGQPITGFSIHHADPDKEIKLNVTVDGEGRSIVFYPHGEAVRIPRYRLGG